jgi:hypothetical protein
MAFLTANSLAVWPLIRFSIWTCLDILRAQARGGGCRYAGKRYGRWWPLTEQSYTKAENERILSVRYCARAETPAPELRLPPK